MVSAVTEEKRPRRDKGDIRKWNNLDTTPHHFENIQTFGKQVNQTLLVIYNVNVLKTRRGDSKTHLIVMRVKKVKKIPEKCQLTIFAAYYSQYCILL